MKQGSKWGRLAAGLIGYAAIEYFLNVAINHVRGERNEARGDLAETRKLVDQARDLLAEGTTIEIKDQALEALRLLSEGRIPDARDQLKAINT